MSTDQEKIRQLEARIAELENTRCACCQPIVREVHAHLIEVATNFDVRMGDANAVVRIGSPWGDIKVPVSRSEAGWICRALGCNVHRRGTLRLEFK